MPNGQTEQKKPFDIESILPLILLASPFLEAQNPGSGIGLAAGISQFQQQRAIRRRNESQTLLGLLSDVDEENLGVAEEALVAQGYDRATVKAMGKASRAFVDPGRAAQKALDKLVEDPELGLIPRRTQIDVGIRRGERATDRAEREAAEGRAEVRDVAREGRTEGREVARETRGDARANAVEARKLLTTIMLDTSASPQSRAQAQKLYQQVTPENASQVLSQAQALVSQVGEAGTGREQQGRQLALRDRMVKELEDLVASGVPDSAARIRAIAKELGLNPASYLQQLARNIRLANLGEQQVRAQIAAANRSGREKIPAPEKLTPAQKGQLFQEAQTRARNDVLGTPGFMTQINPPTPEQLGEIERKARGYYNESLLVALGQAPSGGQPAPGPGGTVPSGLPPQISAAIQKDARGNVTWEGPQGVLAGLRANGITDVALIRQAKRIYDEARRPGQNKPKPGGTRPAPVNTMPSRNF